ncbi:MAG: hypothetical protein ACJA15_001793, partial [Flavobacteriales bacterium]
MCKVTNYYLDSAIRSLERLKIEGNTMKRTITYLTLVFAAAIAFSSCSSSKYSTTQLYEDDDIYYTAGDIYISEAEADHFNDYVNESASNAPQNANNANSDDYYNEDYYNDDNSAVVNNYYGYNQGYGFYNPGRVFTPGWNVGFNSWGGGHLGFNSFYPFGGGYIYGYNAWGRPIYDPFFNPWNSFGYGGNCFNPYNPYGGWNNG